MDKVVIYLFISLLTLGAGYYGNQVLSKPSLEIENTISSPSPTSFIVEPVSPTPTPSDTPTIKKQIAVTDSIVGCQFKQLGIKQLKQSECKKSFECEIESGKFYIYTDKQKCIDDQKLYFRNKLVTCSGINGEIYNLSPEQCDQVTQRKELLNQLSNSLKQTESNMQQIGNSGFNTNFNIPTIAPLPTQTEWHPTAFQAPSPTPIPPLGGCFGTPGSSC